MAGLESLATSFGTLLLKLAGIAGTVLCGWYFFKILIAGNPGRALREAVIVLIIAAVGVAALSDPAGTWAIFAGLGTALFGAIREAVQQAVASNGGQPPA